jgi:hypothetical protein
VEGVAAVDALEAADRLFGKKKVLSYPPVGVYRRLNITDLKKNKTKLSKPRDILWQLLNMSEHY